VAKNNRRAGHAFECDLAIIFRDIGYPEAATTRQMGSKGADDAGVDLVGTQGWTVQAKYTQAAPNMQKLLKSMPGPGEQFNSGRRIVIHKRERQGSTVTMTLEDFVEIARRLMPPVRLCCGQRHAGEVCPDGLVQCCLCFERVGFSDLSVDGHQKTNICQSCADKEKEARPEPRPEAD
jgi:hypothetical protein